MTGPQVILRILLPLHLLGGGVALYFVSTANWPVPVPAPAPQQEGVEGLSSIEPRSVAYQLQHSVYYNDGSETPFDPYHLYSSEPDQPLEGWEDSGLLSADWGLEQ